MEDFKLPEDINDHNLENNDRNQMSGKFGNVPLINQHTQENPIKNKFKAQDDDYDESDSDNHPSFMIKMKNTQKKP